MPLLGDALAPASAGQFPIQIDPHKRPPKKRLLLVLDQIDGYFLAHPDAFVGKDGVVAEPQQVLSANRDWKMLVDKVIGKQLHLLLVCRADAAMLRALNFTGPKSCQLQRIETNRMGQLLDEITRPDAQGEVVEYPEAGWLQLKDRLLVDLADEHSQFLPVRLSLALDALRIWSNITFRKKPNVGRNKTAPAGVSGKDTPTEPDGVMLDDKLDGTGGIDFNDREQVFGHVHQVVRQPVHRVTSTF